MATRQSLSAQASAVLAKAHAAELGSIAGSRRIFFSGGFVSANPRARAALARNLRALGYEVRPRAANMAPTDTCPWCGVVRSAEERCRGSGAWGAARGGNEASRERGVAQPHMGRSSPDQCDVEPPPRAQALFLQHSDFLGALGALTRSWPGGSAAFRSEWQHSIPPAIGPYWPELPELDGAGPP